MVNLICGLGQAGGKILDSMAGHKSLGLVAQPIAINSTLKDLQGLHNVRRADQFGVSEDKGIIPVTSPGFEEHVVGGFGKDPRLADDLLQSQNRAMANFFRQVAGGGEAVVTEDEKAPPCEATTSKGNQCKNNARPGKKFCNLHNDQESWSVVGEDRTEDEQGEANAISFAMIIAGLGGGTGCGTAPLIAKAIRQASSVTTSILFVGVLPATMETSSEKGVGGAERQAWNTRYGLDKLEKVVDGIILVDNERLAFNHHVESLFPEYNGYIGQALLDLISAHLLEQVDMRKLEDASLPVIDIRDITSATSFGSGRDGRTPGYASIGWGADSLRNLGGYVAPGIGRKRFDSLALFEVAKQKQSIHGIDLQQAQKNLGLVRLPWKQAMKPEMLQKAGVVEKQLRGLSTLGETHYGVTVGKRPIASVNTLFTFERDQIQRLRDIDLLAESYAAGGVPTL